jgi:hypothetical protein
VLNSALDHLPHKGKRWGIVKNGYALSVETLSNVTVRDKSIWITTMTTTPLVREDNPVM